ncbi:MAG: hypothetical protein MUO76_11635, partial [Anaerolineaceae bacterium]|nr:hypothetical protein [Anaerolineaceae bacterium]
GEYNSESMPGLPFTIFGGDGGLFISASGFLPEPARLYPEAENKFFIREHGWVLTFSCVEEKLYCDLELMGREIRFVKIAQK